MKTKILMLTGICLLFFSCQNELLKEIQTESENQTLQSSKSSNLKSGSSAILRECKVIDADRHPHGSRQPTANFWWSLNGGNDYFTASTYFSSVDGHSLSFDEYDDLTAHISGSTKNENGCVVEVDVWLKDKKSWNEWSTTEINGLLGEHKKEGTAGNASDSSLMSFYVIDSERSTLTVTGNCGGREGTYGLEQRPDPATDDKNFGAHIGPGGANYDSNLGAIGLSTWGYMFDLNTKERKWVMDFNFLVECVDIPCDPCEGKVTDLTLKYNGSEEAIITVETKKDGENGNKIVYQGPVAPGASFSFVGNDKKGTLGTEIKIYVGDHENTKIHTSCSKPIGPGLISGDFEVIRGSSREGGNLCPVDTPPGGDCGECEGKITELELQYNGDQPATIMIETKKDGENGGKIVFNDSVDPDGTFSFVGNDKKGTLGTEITIYINGVENTKIHTSCSKPIGPGLVSGDFEVISGSSREGGKLCPVNTPPGGDCGDCEGKVTRLDLKYNGSSSANIEVIQKKDNMVTFSGPVDAGETFTINGKDDKGTLGTEIIINVNGVETQRIHTSCSQPIGAGAVFGKFTVMGGASREGGELCPVDTPPSGGDDCTECKGKVTRLDLQYNGSGEIQVIQKKDNMVAFSGSVAAGKTFTFTGKDDKGTLGTEIIIYVNGVETQRIHTSCSQPIGAGAVFGKFTVMGGASREGGELCPVDTPPTGGGECDCAGKIVAMSVMYSGPSGATITVGEDDNGNNSKTFTNVQKGQMLTANLGEIGNWWYWSVNGSVEGKIHTSCSDEILGNVDAHKSYFGNLGTFPDPVENDNNGTFLVVSHTDNKGNTCSIPN